MKSRHLATLLAILSLTAPCHGKSKFPPNTPVPDLTRETVEDTSHTYHLGPTGARGWIHKIGSYASPDDFEAFFSTAQARQILITAVADGSPADGILAPGDVILGIGDTPFASDARRAMANAIDEAEREENQGKLDLLRWRPEGETATVTLQLRVLGTYSDTAPYDCKKSDAIIAQTKAKILAGGLKDRLHIAALGLLATGDDDAIAAVRGFIESSGIAAADLNLTVAEPRGMSAWDWSYAAVLLGEFHQLTGDASVLPALEEYAVHIAKGQAICGSWGHKMADLGYNDGRQNGRLTGYGTLNQPAIICLMAMIVAEQCGIRHPEITRAIGRAGDFYGYFAGKGCIPYGHGAPLEYMLSNNGMTGAAAIAFALNQENERADYFARLTTAAHGKTEIGHTGSYFGTMWAPLGTIVAGPHATAGFFEQHRWLQTLARRWDGGFVYQPPGGRWGGSKEKYYQMSSDGAHLLFYAASRRHLLITGKKADRSLWLDADAAKDAVHAGLIDYASLDADALIKLLDHPVPRVRREAADALGTRDGDHLETFIKMLESGTPDARIGACHAIATRGQAHAAAAPALLKVIGEAEADPWLRGRALFALRALGTPDRDTLESLLRIAIAEKPADPRGDLDFDIATSLVRLTPDPYALELDFDLFHTAANKLLGHRHHAPRNAIMRMLANVPLTHFPAVAERIIEVIRNDNVAYETYHNDAARATGLAILERLGIRDGMTLAVETMEPGKWGQARRVKARLAFLTRYGKEAHAVLPEIKAMRQSGRIKPSEDGAIARIERATRPRDLITLEEALKPGR